MHLFTNGLPCKKLNHPRYCTLIPLRFITVKLIEMSKGIIAARLSLYDHQPENAEA